MTINYDRVQFQFMESGMMDYIGTKWKGQEIPQSQDSDLMILSGGSNITDFSHYGGSVWVIFFNIYR